MDRYIYTEVSQSNNKKVQAYKSTRYPEISATQEDIYIHTRTGDRLDNIAYEYYDDASWWWIIALANNLGKGTLVVPPAMQLRIPSPQSANNAYFLLKTSSEE